jgi:hypothetical protein
MLFKNKILWAILFASIISLPSKASVALKEVTYPKDPAYRVGISELPETRYVQAHQEKNSPQKVHVRLDNSQDGGIADMTYADLSIKNLSREVAQDLEFEEDDMVADLSLLWQGAAMQSDTINFALYKLANPDADKPDEKSIKKVLTTIASMSTLVGAGVGSPILAGSSLIGGNILGIMSQDTKALNYKYTRVTDADMIILIRKVEDLQQKAVNLYYDYMSAKRQLDFATKLVDERQEKFHLAQQNNAPRELVVITDAYYRTALDKLRSAKSDFFSKRATLEQFVGNETFVQFESELASRESGKAKENNDTTTEEIKEEQPFNQPESVFIYPQDETPEDFITTGFSSNIENTTDNYSKKQLKKEKKAEKKLAKQEAKQAKKDEKQTAKQEAKQSKIDAKQTIKDEKQTALEKKQAEKQAEKEAEAEERARAIAKRKDPTKGLIFLHGQDKTTAKAQYYANLNPTNSTSSNSTTQEVTVPTISPQVQTTQPTVDIYGLPPLDEIRVPELTKDGYSIYSELPY